MSSITVDFEFEIGDLVYFRGASHHAGVRPKQFCVYERLAQECHGGIQRMYRVTGGTDLFPAVLLTKEQPPYQPACEEEQDELSPSRHWRNAAAVAQQLEGTLRSAVGGNGDAKSQDGQ